MSDLLDRIQREIRERLAASRAAVLEYERLERALHALADVGSRATQAVSRRGGADEAEPGAPAPAPPPARRGRGGAAKPRPGRAASTRQRAPRGANREAVLRVIGERPGVSANEVAAVSGVKGGTLYALLRTLAQRGEIEKRELPGGQIGYQVASAGAAPPDASVGAAGLESPVAADSDQPADAEAPDAAAEAEQPDESAEAEQPDESAEAEQPDESAEAEQPEAPAEA